MRRNNGSLIVEGARLGGDRLRSPLTETEIMFEFINIFTAIAHSSMKTEAVMMLCDIGTTF